MTNKERNIIKIYIPSIDIYLEDAAVFPNGDVILSYDSMIYSLKENMWISEDGCSGIEKSKPSTVNENGWIVVDNGSCYEYAIPIETSGEWVLVSNEFVESKCVVSAFN